MTGHFSVILMCLSSVYCISNFDNLNLQQLVDILRGELVANEWDAAMDQSIIHNDGSKTIVDVKKTVYNFGQKANKGYIPEREFEYTRSIIKTAYKCTLTKYASITAYFIFQQMWEIKANINWARNHTELKTLNRDHGIDLDFYHKTLLWEKYAVDMYYKLKNGTKPVIQTHNFSSKLMYELHNLWAGFIEKKLCLKINYRVYASVMRTKFKNKYGDPFVEALNEFTCVLNEVIQMLDNFILNNCVEHGKSFAKNFESLKTGVQGDFMWLLNHLDEMKARDASKDGQYLTYSQEGIPSLEARDSNWELYRDFSKPIPGTTPGSGCFVENLEFDISGLKMQLANNINPTDIYGYDRTGSINEIEMKLIENTEPLIKSNVKLGMLLIRDKDVLFDGQPQSSRSVNSQPQSSRSVNGQPQSSISTPQSSLPTWHKKNKDV